MPMISRGLTIALGAGQLFCVFASGLTLWFGSVIFEGPHSGAAAEAAWLVGRSLLIATAALYATFHLGFMLLGRIRGLPALAWSSLAVAVAPVLVSWLPLRLVLIPLVFSGSSLLMARRVLGRGALTAGAFELGSGLLGIFFGPTPPVLLFIPTMVFKYRLLEGERLRESPQPPTVGAHFGAA
jgi:hypothetical protein